MLQQEAKERNYQNRQWVDRLSELRGRGQRAQGEATLTPLRCGCLDPGAVIGMRPVSKATVTNDSCASAQYLQ